MPGKKKAAHAVTAYVKPTCSTCRKALTYLKDGGVEVETVDLFKTPLNAAGLKKLLKQLGLRPRDVLRTKEPIYAELGLGSGNHSDAQVIALMAAHPDLIQRPILVRGDKAVLARPAEKTSEILD